MAESPRILILGANGRLGMALKRVYLGFGLPVIACGRADLDLTLPDLIPLKLAELEFDVLINAAGLTSVDECERQREAAHLSNCEGPRALAEYCARSGRRMIQISTDYVFAGDEPGARKETDPTSPCNHYGRTKLDGEQAVLGAHPDALVIRVSWLFGREKPSFPDMILKEASKQSVVRAVDDKWSSPSYADDLAEWLLELIQKYPSARGIYHLCNAGSASWREYGQEVLNLAHQLGIPLRTREVIGHSMQGFPGFIAKRPAHTALDTTKFKQLTGIKPRPWKEALRDYLIEKFQ